MFDQVLRAPSHVQLQKIGVTREFQPDTKPLFFYFISPWGENISAKVYSIFYKNVLQEKHVS